MQIARRTLVLGLVLTAGAAACSSDDEDTLGPNIAAAIAVSAGNNQSDVLGDTLADSVEVRVTNSRGNPVTGAAVTWAVTAGGGTVAPTTSTTNADGIARAKWVLGGAGIGANTLTATVGGVATPATFTATALAQTFSATLTGAQERPNPVTTAATGTALMTWNGSQLTYQVQVTGNLNANVIAAHIHGPQPDTTINAPVVLDLKPTTGINTGTVASGTATATSGHLAVAAVTMDSVITLLRKRAAYVNVHTSLHPGGELRGQSKTP